ncbi:cytochrome P450 2J2-like [Ambystoma mexicanum]|uniref:cytochrome P450 2J2-like n=1 Tax=Ambystoma mexicanum TaxID=8296 RepID=UPI0037E85556
MLDLGLGLITVVIVLLLLQYLKVKRTAKQLPPGPTPLPIIGNLWTLEFNLHYETLMQLTKTYGNIYTLWVGPTPVVVANGYEAVRDALVISSSATQGRAVTPIVKIYGRERGIIGANGHVWQQQRRFGAVTLRKLGLGKNTLECRIQEEVLHLLEGLESQKGQPVDPAKLIGWSVSNTIAALILGHRFARDNQSFLKLIEATDFATHFMGSKWGQVYEAAPSIMRFLPGPHHMYPVHRKYLSAFMKQEVKYHKENPTNEPQDLIDFYLEQMSKPKEDPSSTFDDKNLNQVLMDFFVAASETTILSLCWALLHMVSNPDIQEKIQKELQSVIGATKVIEYEDRKKLPYTNATVHEVLRYNPVVPMALPHWCVKDAVIQGHPVRKGTILLANIASVGYDPAHWETPKKFNPNHFLDTDGNFVMKEAFFPFSAGPRVCLGERLAKTVVFTFFANLLRGFTFRLASGEKDVNLHSMFGTTLKPMPCQICALPNQNAKIH